MSTPGVFVRDVCDLMTRIEIAAIDLDSLERSWTTSFDHNSAFEELAFVARGSFGAIQKALRVPAISGSAIKKIAAITDLLLKMIERCPHRYRILVIAIEQICSHDHPLWEKLLTKLSEDLILDAQGIRLHALATVSPRYYQLIAAMTAHVLPRLMLTQSKYLDTNGLPVIVSSEEHCGGQCIRIENIYLINFCPKREQPCLLFQPRYGQQECGWTTNSLVQLSPDPASDFVTVEYGQNFSESATIQLPDVIQELLIRVRVHRRAKSARSTVRSQ